MSTRTGAGNTREVVGPLSAARPADELQPIHDADDLHEVDLDVELWHRLPDQPAS